MTSTPSTIEHPARVCNGGPNGSAWCGKPATRVCMDRQGLQWFACDDDAHREGAQVEPIASWMQRVELLHHESANQIRKLTLELERSRKITKDLEVELSHAQQSFSDDVDEMSTAMRELEQRRADEREAAGELIVEIPPAGSVASKLLSANVIMRRELEALRNQLASSNTAHTIELDALRSQLLTATQEREAVVVSLAEKIESIKHYDSIGPAVTKALVEYMRWAGWTTRRNDNVWSLRRPPLQFDDVYFHQAVDFQRALERYAVPTKGKVAP